MRTLRWIGLLVVAAGGLLLALAPYLLDDKTPATLLAILNTMPLWYIPAGLIVMAKRPWHPIGWLLLLMAVGLAFTSLPLTPSRLDPRWYPWFTWIGGAWGGYFGYTAMTALLVSFPDGISHRPARDRRAAWAAIGAMTVVTVGAALSNPVAATGSDGSATFRNPLGVNLVPRAFADGGYVGVFVLLIVCIVWLWRRQRRAGGEERRRYTLILYSFSILMAGLVLGIVLSSFVGDIAWIGALLGWFSVPVAFAYAVVRHGLYGVDQLVRRTVTYGVVGVIVALVYAVPVILLPRFLGETSDLVVAASTLAAAAVFNPIRRRIQHLVDRRFNRSRYDAEAEVGLLGSILRDSVDLDTTIQATVAVTARTLQPTSSALWIREHE